MDRYVPLLVYVLTALVIIFIPLKIISSGYLPPDDALADAGKAVSGKPWSEILVLGSPARIDSHIGWHGLLRLIHLATAWQPEGLVIFSVVLLFALVGWSALPWLGRPEAWLITLILVPGIGMEFMGRFMLGRPLLVSISVLITVLFIFQLRHPSPPGKGTIMAMTGLIATAVLLHGVWFLWALPVAAFWLARQYRWAIALTAGWLMGTLLAAICTGRPYEYVTEAVWHTVSAVGSHPTESTLVSELQPTPGNMFGLLLLGGLLVMKHLAKLETPRWSRSPAFWLACLGWVLGYKAARFWEDWGLPALMVLMAVELDAFLKRQMPFRSLQRLGLTAGLAATLYLVATCDVQSRWTGNSSARYLDPKNPDLAGWLPDSGGIFYDVDMGFFYRTFYEFPKGDWRYMVGFEPVLMPPEDFDIYQQIVANNGEPQTYLPWVKKMRPADRLVLNAGPGSPPPIPQLEWNYLANNLWIGRLPRAPQKNSPASAK